MNARSRRSSFYHVRTGHPLTRPRGVTRLACIVPENALTWGSQVKDRRSFLRNITFICAATGAFFLGDGALAQNPLDAIPDRWLTNQDVIEMLQSGLSARAVILRIHDSPCKFDKSAEGLERLRAASVPYKVLTAMMQAPELPPPVKGRIPMVVPDSTLVEVVLSESLDTAK